MSMLASLPIDVEPTDPAERVRVSRFGTNHVLYSPEGTVIATSDVRMNVTVRREEEVLFRRQFEDENPKIRSSERVRGLAFTPDCSNLWIAAGDTLRVANVHSGEVWWEFTPDRSFGFLISSPQALAVAQGGEVAVAFDSGVMAIGRYEVGRSVHLQAWKDNDTPKHLAFRKEGGEIIGVDGFCIAGWDAALGRKLFRLAVKEKIYGAAFHPQLPLVAVRHLASFSLWDLDRSAPVYSGPVNIGLPLIAFHPTRQWIALGSQRSVQLISFEGEPVAECQIEDANVVSFAFSPRGDELAVGCSDEVLRRFTVGK